MFLTSLHLFPVKSLGGVDAAAAQVERWGLRNDRRWLVCDRDGAVVTAREEHAMLGLTATPQGDAALLLTAPDGSTLRVEAPLEGERIPTTLSRLESVRAASAEADEWLSRQLARPVRLGWLDDPSRRTIAVDHGGHANEPLTLADAGPLLLTTTASLRRLNDWIDDDLAQRGKEPLPPLVMGRFRPNVVVDEAAAPFAEDAWREVRIGGVEFRFAEHCDRCVLTTIDPQALTASKEPLRTLAKRRRWDNKTWFGVRLVPLTTGTIRVGDPVSVA